MNRALMDRELIEAAWAADLETAGRLLEAGADVNAKDETEQSAYLIATSEGPLELLELTLEHGGDVRSVDSYRGTGLIRAAERGLADVVGRLIRAGIALDHVNRLGWTALHESLIFAQPDRSEDYIDTVRVLVAAGADLRLASQAEGLGPVALARRHGLDAQAELLQRAIDSPLLGRREAEEQLFVAALLGDADAAAVALRSGARVDARNGLDQTALLIAATHSRVSVARLLVALGADPDALDHQHDTPVLVSSLTGNVRILEILLTAGPDLTIANRHGGTAIIPASARGHVEFVRRLLRTGIDLDHANSFGWTPLLQAVVLGGNSDASQEIVRLLVVAGADRSIRDNEGMTALEHAHAKGYTAMAGMLADGS